MGLAQPLLQYKCWTKVALFYFSKKNTALRVYKDDGFKGGLNLFISRLQAESTGLRLARPAYSFLAHPLL